MRARSALFDVYGDLLRQRGDQARVADLVRLLGPLGISAPAVRTAISRIVAEGWLEPVQFGGGRGYRATELGIARLDEAHRRIYRLQDRAWDGRWRLVFLDPVRDRGTRDRVRTTLNWMGLGELGDGLWVTPWPQPDLPAFFEREGVTAAHAEAVDFTPATRPLAAWDLVALGEEYAAWLTEVRAAPDEPADSDRAQFARRFRLVHEWRKFLFRDPGLPPELLPTDFPGSAAAAHFRAEAERLRPGAEAFVDRILS